jgi:hypothetical protein
MRVVAAVVLLLVIATAPAWGAKLYRWVDAQGRVFYTDKPPPIDAREAEKLRLSTRPGEVALPYEMREAAKHFPVTLFSGDCGQPCDAGRKLLDSRSVPFTLKDGQDAAAREELKKISGALEVPVLQVGRTLLKGFEAGQWNAALDAAGYPKSVLQRPVPPAKEPPSTPGTKPAPAPAPAEGKPAAGHSTAGTPP